MTGVLPAALAASVGTAVTSGNIPAPSIEYSQLSPMLIVFGAAVVGVLVEAFAPRPLRRGVQLVIALASLAAKSPAGSCHTYFLTDPYHDWRKDL